MKNGASDHELLEVVIRLEESMDDGPRISDVARATGWNFRFTAGRIFGLENRGLLTRKMYGPDGGLLTTHKAKP